MSGATAAPLLAAEDALASTHLHLAPLDGVRVLCCVLIMCGHLFMYGVPQGSSVPYPLVGLEFLSAVSMFMVLSGFTLVVVYSGSQREGQHEKTAPFSAPGSVRVFLTRRLVRLAPIYYLSLAVALPWLLLYSSGTNIAVSIPLTLLMLQSLVPASLSGYWNGPLWQISALMLCYWGFPLLLGRLQALATAQLRRLLNILALLAFALPVAVIGLVFSAGGGFSGAAFIHTFGPYRILQFVMGMAGGLLACGSTAVTTASSAGDPDSSTAVGGTVAPASAWRLNVLTASLLGCGVAVLATVGSLPDGQLRFYAWMGLNYIAEYSLPLLQVHWLLALTTAPAGTVSRFLQLPPFRWLGDASYAIYCLHWPVIMWCGWAVVGKGITAEAMPLVPRANGAIEGWFPFPVWAVPLLVIVCAAVGSLAEKLLGSTARKARKAALISVVQVSRAAETPSAISDDSIE